MPVLVRRKAPGAPRLETRIVTRILTRMLETLGLEQSELSVLLLDDAGMREVNREHRGKDKPTDVLAFPQAEFREPLLPRRGHSLAVLGDVLVSLDTAARQARARRRELEDEVRFLLAHGLLHLVGYDHATAEEKAEMSRATRALVVASRD
jgi:probable rRNA maturation factor